jgi:triphosphoribosyl-dephospho-CoA synthase
MTSAVAAPGGAIDRVTASFLRACELDVAVRKPGNVSLASPGHGMQAAQFTHSARAAAGPLCQAGARVGARIEAAQAASWTAAGCNTNLGIVLLCAPIAAAVERLPASAGPIDIARLKQPIEDVLAGLDLDDARAAFRAISHARPGGLGSAPSQDVHAQPTIGLREAMTLAAGRDSIARQYRDGFADVLVLAGDALGEGFHPGRPGDAVAPLTARVVQRVFLAVLARLPDSHIVRKHGEGMAQIVMAAAQGWHARAQQGECLAADAAFAAWDTQLKNAGINPGTTADLTVAALMLAGVAHPPAQVHGTDRD